MNEQEKKRQGIYDLLNIETKANFLCLLYTKQRKDFFSEKELFEEKKMEERIEQKKQTKIVLTALAIAINKDLIMSIKNHANELKVHEKTVRKIN